MENIYKKIQDELDSLSVEEREKILIKLRDEIDEIDKMIVPLLGRRSLNAILIGRVKRTLDKPTYDPERERDIANKIKSYNKDPLSDEALLRIYERIIDESRSIQKEEIAGNIVNIPKDKMKISFKNILTKKQYLFILFFFIGLLAFFYYTFFTPNYYSMPSPVKFEIKRGETLNEVAARLEQAEIIPGENNFKVAAFIYGAEKKIKAARYYIPNGLSYLSLVDLFINGEADFLRKLTIDNGSSLGWVAAKLKNDASIDSGKFIQSANDKKIIDSLGFNAASLEGYILPQEYYFYERSSVDEVLDTFLVNINNFFSDSIQRRVDESGYSLHDVLTLASIVEGETNITEEMPVIAAVYLNRLRIGMKLQADPTVQYLQQNGWKRLLYKDLQIDNPYNTYRYSGLPPGPINNPGKNAILAVLYPDDNKFLFFVADGKGGHKFARNYSEHLRNVREYRKWYQSQEQK